MRVESEYSRGGTLAYFAAYDVHQARVLGRCEPTTGIAPFSHLVDQVMTSEPYAGARRVFWIVDNGASHRNWAAAARMNDAFPNAHMIHLPVHASWLNQMEIYFSAVQRKALTPDDFHDLDEVAERLLSFQHHYNTTAQPFDWTFTSHDLNQLLTRIGRHDRHAPPPLSLSFNLWCSCFCWLLWWFCRRCGGSRGVGCGCRVGVLDQDGRVLVHRLVRVSSCGCSETRVGLARE